MNRLRRSAVTSIVLTGLGFLYVPVSAQEPVSETATVMTDGLAYPHGEISKAITELSVKFDETDKLRLLPLMGRAGFANLRDLLRFRGVDMAIVNSDVFALNQGEKDFRIAREKLRYITKLRTQKAILLARKDIAEISQLSGKKVLVFGPETVSLRTASTLFNLLDIKAGIVPAAEVSAAGLADAEAVFFFDTDSPPEIAQNASLHALAIPANEALSKFYRRAEIQRGSQTVETIEADTILATFNWLPRHGRYADVRAFIDIFFAALPTLRRTQEHSIWNQTDPHAEVLGWKQYTYASAVKKTVPPPPKTENAPTVISLAPTKEEASPAPVQENTGVSLAISVISQPPLTDEQFIPGGLITELLTAALARTDWPGADNLALKWEKNRAAQIDSVLVQKNADLALPWIRPSCSDSAGLSGTSATLCDGVIASDPIFKVLMVYFTRTDSDFSPSSEEQLDGRTICRPADRDLTPLGELVTRLVAEGRVHLVRPPTLVACLDLLSRKETDALLINELEGKLAISQLGLANMFRIVETPPSAQPIHVVVAKDAPKAKELMDALNKGIAQLKSEPAYSQIVMKHISPLSQLGTQ